MSLTSRVSHGIKWQAITIIGRQLLSLVVFTPLARLLDPAAFGLVGLISVYMLFVGMFVDQGIGVALVQRRDLEPEHLDTAFCINLCCAVLLCLITIGFAGPVSVMFGDVRLAPLLRWSSLGIVIGAFQEIQVTLFVREMDFRKTAIRTLLANAAGGAVGIGMALAGYGVWSLIGQQLSSALAGACFLWSVSHYRPSLRISFKHLRDLFHVSSSVFSTSFLWFFTSRLDQIVIGRFAGVSILGLYTIAGKVPDFARNATQQPLADVSFPAITSLQDDHDQMNAFTYKGMQANAILSFAVFVGIAAIAPDLLPVLFGTKWAVAAGICSLLSLNALVGGMQIFFRPLLLASGGMRQWVTLNAIQCSGVAAACIGGIQFGVRYLVIGLILNGFFLIFLTLLFLRKKIGLSPAKYCLPCLIPALAALVMVCVIWVTASILPSNTTPVLRLGIKVVLGAISYVGIVWLLRPVELKNLISTVGRSFRGAELTAAIPPLS